MEKSTEPQPSTQWFVFFKDQLLLKKGYTDKDLNPMVDEQNVCREVKYRQIAVTHRLVDVNESRFIRSCSFVSVCFPQSAF
jgi:hypothetical protein